ncbi:Fic family protein [Sphingobacterium luzhongxinii]|uniref:Fic family protein n=1 Tax=Sphingobacterium luzhongxinii TaxID=2654181 RepID=UPI0013DC8A0C|nr:Fic/DOC family N-terminal domain-containing protein [Sphingobacterium sp. xlx-73]
MNFDKNIPYNGLPDLPPVGVAIETSSILKQLAQASRHLGELKGLCESLPDPQLLINTLVLQESKDSTAIENIVTTQDELYKATLEEDNVQNHAAKEVLKYRQALYKGIERLNERDGLILTNTMIEIVRTIKQNNSGIRTTPGTALKNAINGEVVYTPPAGEEIIRQKLYALEQFINNEIPFDVDPLIKMAMLHYQFEAIHPFADGNGRTGRIISAIYLVQQKLLDYPILYLSSYIVKYKNEYYQLLKGITETGNWEDWIMYILTAISETAQLTISKIREMLILRDTLEKSIKEVLGASYKHELLQLLFTLPYVKIEILEQHKIAHRQTASIWLSKLVNNNILRTQKIGRTTYYINYKLLSILS